MHMDGNCTASTTLTLILLVRTVVYCVAGLATVYVRRYFQHACFIPIIVDVGKRGVY